MDDKRELPHFSQVSRLGIPSSPCGPRPPIQGWPGITMLGVEGLVKSIAMSDDLLPTKINVCASDLPVLRKW
jgi:hypothetical protein